jgi:hypothetical protein
VPISVYFCSLCLLCAAFCGLCRLRCVWFCVC